MPSSPLVYVFFGLALILAPAGKALWDASAEQEETAPGVIATRGDAHSDCMANSVLIAGGGRIGCTSTKGPKRRNDAGGALFVRVEQ